MAEPSSIGERRYVGNMERHVQTILISIITGSIVFAANYVYSDSRDKAVQQTQLQVLTSQVIDQVKDLEQRVRALEVKK